jgi:hypothetical protein
LLIFAADLKRLPATKGRDGTKALLNAEECDATKVCSSNTACQQKDRTLKIRRTLNELLVKDQALTLNLKHGTDLWLLLIW